jgi:ATP-binding cassette subfamily B protein
VDVLYGLREPASGVLEIDGHDSRDVSLADLRNHIKLVRTPELFEGTILENLRAAAPEVDTAEARATLARVGLLDDVAAFADGLHTKLSTGGQPLSPGQSRQLEIARAILASPRLLILDEALDHLDDLPERGRLLDCLFDPSAGWTLVVVSEDREILERCERVFRIRNGNLVEATQWQGVRN